MSATKGLNTLPSSEEARSKEGIDWNKVLLQTQADVLAAKIAGLSVKINTQRLLKLCVPATCLGSFFRDKRKIQDLLPDRCYSEAGSQQAVETETVYYCVVWNRYRRY